MRTIAEAQTLLLTPRSARKGMDMETFIARTLTGSEVLLADEQTVITVNSAYDAGFNGLQINGITRHGAHHSFYVK